METTATILHADLDAFYASVEQMLDPVAARQADRGRRRRGARRLLRGQGVRRPRRHAGAAGARAVSRTSSSSAAILTSTSGWATRRSRCSAISRRWSSASPSMRRSPTWPAARICSARRRRSPRRSASGCGPSWACRSRSGLRAPSTSPRSRRKWPSPTVWWSSIRPREREFLHALPVELMWGVGPGDPGPPRGHRRTHDRRSSRQHPGYSLERLLGAPRRRNSRRSRGTAIRARSRRIGARIPPAPNRRSGASRRAAHFHARRCAISPTALRVGCAPSRGVGTHRDGAGAVRRPALGHPRSHARCADLGHRDPCRDRRRAGAGGAARSSRGTHDLAARDLRHRISRKPADMQLDLPLGLADERRRPGARRGIARFARRPRDRQASATGSAGRRSATDRWHWGLSRSVPDAFRELAEKEL